MTSKIAFALATWFGCGYAPKGPGTAGSLGGLVIAVLLVHYASWPASWFAILALICTPVGIWAAGVVARESGRKDPQIVVIDEVLGQWLTLAGASQLNWKTFALGFALFRLFDIWKPVPVRQFEKLPGGTGIVADDLMAGVYGAAVLIVLDGLLSTR
jgi:phosphatidylglycerophosphatase A